MSQIANSRWTPLSPVWETLVFLRAGTEQQCVGHRRGNPADARHNQGEAQLAAKLFVDVAVKRIVLWPLRLCDVADDVVFIACALRMAPSCHIVHHAELWMLWLLWQMGHLTLEDYQIWSVKSALANEFLNLLFQVSAPCAAAKKPVSGNIQTAFCAFLSSSRFVT